jgi:hypothetical protein
MYGRLFNHSVSQKDFSRHLKRTLNHRLLKIEILIFAVLQVYFVTLNSVFKLQVFFCINVSIKTNSSVSSINDADLDTSCEYFYYYNIEVSILNNVNFA